MAASCTLDDTSWLVPLAHYFMRSAQPWERLANAAACFATLPSETEILPLVKRMALPLAIGLSLSDRRRS
jgi:hypothetical protein